MSPSMTVGAEQVDRSTSPTISISSGRMSTEETESSDAAQVPCPEEAVDLEELETFAGVFKQKRIRLGFTQGDVGLALGRFYGVDFSQTTISRFEALNLSFKNMCKLKPLLQKWLDDTEAAVQAGTYNSQMLKNQAERGTVESPAAAVGKRRKRRTSIEGNLRTVLEQVFKQNPRPSPDMMDDLAKTLDMKREVIRVWFCNRRQKERRSLPDKVGTADVSIIDPILEQRNSLSSGTTASVAGLFLLAQNPYLVGLSHLASL